MYDATPNNIGNEICVIKVVQFLVPRSSQQTQRIILPLVLHGLANK